MRNLNPQLGSTGGIVQIDESLIFRRKSNRGRIGRQQWVFGAYDQRQKRGFCRHVLVRDAATLLPLVQQWVVPGAEVHSDQWRAYGGLTAFGFTHRTVNHSQNFVDPVTGACTNNVEAYWGRIKKGIKRVSGSVGAMKWSHLDEAVYRDWFGVKAETN